MTQSTQPTVQLAPNLHRAGLGTAFSDAGCAAPNTVIWVTRKPRCCRYAAAFELSHERSIMLTLCGFAGSNYYNKVKFALLEKGAPFEEELTWVGQTDPAASPLGKVPYLQTEHGPLCESAVMLEYIEQRYPQNPLLPADPFAAAKVRELALFLDLHLELVVRNLYPEAFFCGKISDATKEKTAAQLEKNIAAFAQLAQFAPFVAGETLTVADCAAVTHLPLVSGATKLIYGKDFLAHLPVRDYIKMMNERPTMQQVNADRKANTELMLARMKAR